MAGRCYRAGTCVNFGEKNGDLFGDVPEREHFANCVIRFLRTVVLCCRGGVFEKIRRKNFRGESMFIISCGLGGSLVGWV